MEPNDAEKDHAERRNSNTEYVPTKCRITKPPPPKPAANPLQFIKVDPSPLFQKAKEQIKKVEEIKKERKEIREETEDWQANLDNWKSSRRKRQEHIIERVVEVKKIELEEIERSRRKSKTFSEMMEERNKNKGRHKYIIPLYDDDSNDLSDYGIGSSSSKTNSIKDVDTDDSCSILDEKDQFETASNKDVSSNSNQSQSEDEYNIRRNSEIELPHSVTTYSNQLSSIKPNIYNDVYQNAEPKEHYTYEGAIEDYRSRIKTKINDSIFTKSIDVVKGKEFSEAQTAVPKGVIFKRKELFDKPVEISHYESNTTRRLSEDFANSQSIKQRLQNLEKCSDISIKSVDKSNVQLVSVKNRLQNFILQNEADNRNNNDIKTAPNKISNYLLQQTSNKSNINIRNNRNSSEWRNKEDVSDRSSSPEAELYMNKLNLFDRELDTLYNKSSNISDNGLEDIHYPPSTSSTELMGLSSDREDSGIHTADVSCSVSQADEPVEDGELASNTIPSCIEKLNKEKELQQIQEFEETVEDMENLDNNNTDVLNQEKDVNFSTIANLEMKHDSSPSTPNVVGYLTKDDVINSTIEFLDSIKRDASANLFVANISKSTSNMNVAKENITEQPIVKVDRSMADAAKIVKTEGKKTGTVSTTHLETEDNVSTDQKNVPIYENVQLRPYLPPNPDFATDLIADNFLLNGDFSFASSKAVEPPKVKPPPPPPAEEDITPQPVKRLNSTKRIKKEIHLKRSSFLGLDEPTDYQIDPDLALYKPPDINYFLQNESKLEKSSYRKQQEDRVGLLNKGESQDSGLDIDRGRLSSDTWCSSMSAHERQDSGQTNSITSEEDEIAKKEREIIELIEKEEMSRDGDFKSHDDIAKPTTLTLPTAKVPHYEPTLGSEKFNNPYFPQISSDYLGDQDSEVLKVEQELRELEKEELKRQRHNLLFRESCAKARLKSNRHSLENICDETYSAYHEGVDHRKSMPELQHIPLEYRKSVPSSYIYHSSPENEVQYRKSMPNIQHVYQKSAPVYRNTLPESDVRVPREVDHRKSMPELQHDGQRSTFKSLASNRQPILPGKPLRPVCSKEQKEHFMAPNPVHSDSIVNGRGGSRNLTRHSIQALSAVPRNRSIPNDNWVQLRANPEVKNYNEHWLYQEAELRRLQDQQKNLQARNWSHPRQEKHLPDAVIQSLTQRVQNRMDRNPQVPIRRSSVSPNKDFPQHPYLGHPQTMGHALPVSYPPPITIDDNQDRMLSVSGKKKCSYCGNELGRGAAMIIESLCLFYHMECFKCCVCHMQLGDGLMGTDVRVRNQKLHCHNCYSSDDGVKFSCV